MPKDNKKVNIGMFQIDEILKLKAPGARGSKVVELLLQQCRHSGELSDEPAYLIEIDCSYVDVYEVEGEPLHITIRYASDEHEPDQATPPLNNTIKAALDEGLESLRECYPYEYSPWAIYFIESLTADLEPDKATRVLSEIRAGIDTRLEQGQW